MKLTDKRLMVVVVAAIAAAVAMLVAGCGGSTNTAQGGGGSSTAGGGAKTLNLLAWEGYTEPQWVKPFEQQNHVKVNISYVGSDDELFAKVRGGGGKTFDLVATNRANLGPLSQAGLIVPLDESRLQHFKQVYPQLANAGTRVGGKLYAAPYVWGSIPLMYSAKAFPTPPNSWGAVFNPSAQTCGKVLLAEDAGTAISTAALYLGIKQVYQLSDAQLKQVKQVLMKARKCSKAFYSGFGDAANYFASGDVTVGLSLGSLITKLAAEKGAKVNEVIPKEGALGWMDTWAITKGGSSKLDLAYKWINYAESPEVQAEVSKKTSLAPTVQGASDKLDPALKRALHLDDPSYLGRLVPMESPQGTDTWQKRLDLWNLIKAG
jgi:spermidine/putrescine transport system substrate-binding protein